MQNLRAIGIAISTFAVENRDQLPGPQYEIVNVFGVLPDIVSRYNETPFDDLWMCPANRRLAERNRATWNKFSSYLTHYPLFGYPLEPAQPNMKAFTQAQIREGFPPEEQWLLRDIDFWAYPDSSIGGEYGPVHSGSRNVLYLDGHVECVRSIPNIKP